MPATKRASEAAAPAPKRRSSRQAAAAAAAAAAAVAKPSPPAPAAPKARKPSTAAKPADAKPKARQPSTAAGKPADAKPKARQPSTAAGKPADAKPKARQPSAAAGKPADAKPKARDSPRPAGRAVSEDPDPDAIPATNPEAPRHEGEWYWLMKAEPESRLENGIDVRFSIDDLRAKTRPEGWDGIRAYAARNHMRTMNAGDKAFFYHSNCKEPGIVGTMEIVREFSEDKSARRAGTPYYDAASTREKPRWSLVHVEFRSKFAVPITLRELREMGGPGGPLADMQMLKQSRLSVSRVAKDEWDALCKVADDRAREAGLEHET